MMSVLVLFQMSSAGAAPVSGLGDQAAEAPAAAGQSRSRGLAGSGDGGKAQEVSTGNRNLDLLIDMQAGAGVAAKAASRPASSAAKVPLPNTNLSGGVLTRIQSGGASAPLRDRDVLGDLRSEVHHGAGAQDPTEKRQWAGGSTAQRGEGDDGDGGNAHGPTVPVEDPLVLRLLRGGIDWLRLNRWEVLGAMLGLAVVSGLIKAYTRRP